MSLARLAVRLLPNELSKPLEKYIALRLISRRNSLIILVVTLVGIAFEAFGIGMLYPILDFVQNGSDVVKLSEESELWRRIIKAFAFIGLPVNLVVLSAAVFILVTLRQVTTYLVGLVIERERYRIGRDLSVRTFNAIMRANAKHIQSYTTGEFSYIINTLCQSSGSLVRVFATLWGKGISVMLYGIVIFSTAPMLALLACVFGLITLMSVSRFVKIVHAISKEFVTAAEVFTTHLTESFMSWRLIKLSGALKCERQNISDHTHKLFTLNYKQTRVSGFLMLVIMPMTTGLALIILYISVEVLATDLATIALFFVILFRLMPIVEAIAKQRQTAALIDAMLERVMNANMNAEKNVEVDAGSVVFDGLQEFINFKNVSFTYDVSGDHVLNNVSAQVPANKMTAIIGPSGAGKSTFVDLLPRLIEPSSGQINFDGHPINQYTLESLRGYIHFVSQTPLILNASVIDNIAYTHADTSMEDIITASKLAHAHEFISKMEGGYNTVLGEGGFRLSGGQRQRIALARAFLQKKGILILDEPTSALDYETEAKIQESLQNILNTGKMTVIIIAHRLSTVSKADHVIALEDGHIVESGKPANLKRYEEWFSDSSPVTHANEGVTT